MAHFSAEPGHGPGVLKVFDLRRWPVRIFRFGASELIVWDGRKDNGTIAAAGVYIYNLEFDSVRRTGTVTVLR